MDPSVAKRLGRTNWRQRRVSRHICVALGCEEIQDDESSIQNLNRKVDAAGQVLAIADSLDKIRVMIAVPIQSSTTITGAEVEKSKTENSCRMQQSQKMRSKVGMYRSGGGRT